MKNEQVRYVMLILPENSPFIQRVRNEHFPGSAKLSTGQRLVYAMQDPAFLYHLISCYVRAGEQLPKEIGSPVALRAYRCLESENETKHSDPLCHQALALGHPANMELQTVLKAYLSSCLTYDEVAARLRIDVEVIKIF